MAVAVCSGNGGSQGNDGVGTGCSVGGFGGSIVCENVVGWGRMFTGSFSTLLPVVH